MFYKHVAPLELKILTNVLPNEVVESMKKIQHSNTPTRQCFLSFLKTSHHFASLAAELYLIRALIPWSSENGAFLQDLHVQTEYDTRCRR